MLAASLLLAALAAAPGTERPHGPSDSTARRDSVAAAKARAAAAAATVALLPGSVDSVLVEKGQRRLTLFVSGLPARTYRVALGFNPVGPKRLQGDGKTPEGLYVIDRRNPQSKYYRSLHISYPNAVDRFLAKEKGFTAGGDVMLHGLPPEHAKLGAGHTQWDWTEGCVALTNQQIDELWMAVADGTPIRIKP